MSPPDLAADEALRSRRLGRALGVGASGDRLFGL
jgi:hypothetical protein